jgi:apolipoprotein N-acyltransferase
MAKPVPKTIDELQAVSRRAQVPGRTGGATTRPELDLIVWPEHDYHQPIFVALPGDPHRAGAEAPPEASLAEVRQIARRFEAGLVVGAGRCPAGRDNPPLYNSLVYLNPEGEYGGSYDKISVVPLLEFQPPLGRLIMKLTGIPFAHPRTLGNREYTKGQRRPIFRIGSMRSHESYRFGGCICYDVFYSGVFRPYLTSPRGEPTPDFFVNIANSTMTPGSSWSALCDLRFRAIEFRRPFVRSCWDGHTAVVDSNGRVLAIDDRIEERKKAVVAELPIDDRGSLYASVGDVLPWTVTVLIDAYLATLVVRWWKGGGRLARVRPGGPRRLERALETSLLTCPEGDRSAVVS